VTNSESRLLILTAFKAEARLLAAILPDCHQSGSGRWEFAGGKLASGNAAGREALLGLLNKELAELNYDRIVLFGAAGALAEELELGQLFICNKFIHADMKLDLSITAALPAATIVTVDQPVFSKEARMQLCNASTASLVDMESFFFAMAMHEQSRSCAVIRFVSDTASTPFALPFAGSIAQNIARHRARIVAALFGQHLPGT